MNEVFRRMWGRGVGWGAEASVCVYVCVRVSVSECVRARKLRRNRLISSRELRRQSVVENCAVRTALQNLRHNRLISGRKLRHNRLVSSRKLRRNRLINSRELRRQSVAEDCAVIGY